MNYHISLIGFMGCGKSTTGAGLAMAMQRPLYDVDSIIEKLARKSIAQIFADDGEAAFRICEYQTLLKSLSNRQMSIIVCGGGAPCFFDSIKQLNAYSVTIYLQASVETLYARLQPNITQRPMLHGKMNLKKYIEEIVAQRESFYNQAKYTVCIEKRSIKEIIEDIKNIYTSLNY